MLDLSFSLWQLYVQKFNEYRKRIRKQSLLHNVSELAEHLFQVTYTYQIKYSSFFFHFLLRLAANCFLLITPVQYVFFPYTHLFGI